MTLVITVVIIVIVVELVFLAVLRAMRNRVFDRYLEALKAGDTEGALDALTTKQARFALPEYNRTYMRLNAHQIAGDDEACARDLSELLNMSCSKEQRREVVVKAYYFYLGQGRTDDAKPLLHEIESGGDEALTKRAQLAWATFAENDTSHIATLEKEFDAASKPIERMNIAVLLVAQYTNAGDLEGAKVWSDRAAELAKRSTKQTGDEPQS